MNSYAIRNKRAKNFSVIMTVLMLFQMITMMFSPLTVGASSGGILEYEPYQSRDGQKFPLIVKGVTPGGQPYDNRQNALGHNQGYRIDGKVVFCIEMGVPAYPGPGYVVHDADRFDFNWEKTNPDELAEVVYHGYKWYEMRPETTNVGRYEAATQVLIWKLMGARIDYTTAFAYTDQNGNETPGRNTNENSYYMSPDRFYNTPDAPNGTHPKNPTQAWENWADATMKRVANHSLRPSFSGEKLTIKVGETVTLRDENGVFKDFEATRNFNPGGLKINKSGNRLQITATNNSSDNVKLEYQKYKDEFVKKDMPRLVYTKPNSQTMGEFYLSDPVPFELNIEVIKHGSLNIIKKGNDTDKNLAGAVFEIYDGDKLVETATTGSNGTVKVDGLDHDKTYTVKEVKAPYGYTVNTNDVNVKIVGGETKDVSFTNEAVVARINVSKVDSETGTEAQGDAKLGNEEVSVLDAKGNVVDEGVIPHGETWTSKDLPLGDYTVIETKVNEGYNLQTKEYPVSLTYQGQNESVVVGDATVENDVIKGKVAIEKYSLDVYGEGNSGFLHELEGAEFTFTLKSSGEVHDVITTDKDGKAETKDLPFGTYIVSETKTPEGFLRIGDFEVEIKENNKKLTYRILDDHFSGTIKIIKEDKETKKPIAVAGTTFKIYDVAKEEFITQKINYPTPMELEEFVTNEEGYLVLPEPLQYGYYELHEVQAPEGYVLDGEPIPFEVTEEAVVDGLITVAFGNFPQMGTATIYKTGEMVSGAEVEERDFGDLHKLEFEQRGLEGVTFTVIAKEDIVTNDGTVRAEAGEVVETITTNADGYATTSELHLGKYEFVEIDAPKGYVLDTTPIPFELEYAGQEIEVTNLEGISAYNYLQTLAIQTHKVDEYVMEWVDGEAVTKYKPSDDKLFGFFTREPILFGEEEIVPADALVGYAFTSEGISEILGKYPAGKYYIQEIQVLDSHVVPDTQYDVELSFENNNKVYDIFLWGNGIAYNKLENFTEFEDEELVEEGAEENEGDEITTPVEPDKESLLNRLMNALFGTGKKDEEFDGEETNDDYPITLPIEDPITDWKSEQERQEKVLEEVGKVFDVFSSALENRDADLLRDLLSEGLAERIEADTLSDDKLLEYFYDALEGAETLTGRVIHNEVHYTYVEGDIHIGVIFAEINGEWLLADIGNDVGETEVPEFIEGPGTEEPGSEDEETGLVVIDGAEPIVNDLVRGDFELIKTDIATGELLPNAKFEIRNEDGEVIREGETDEEGIAYFEDLPYGKYTYREYEAPEGYVIDESEYPFEIKEDGTIVKAEMKNKLIEGDFELTKTDVTTGELLPNAKFEIKDEEGNIVRKGETDEEGIAYFEELEYGKYTYREYDAPEGYVIDESEYPFEIKEDGVIVKAQMTNRMIEGDFELTKTDVATGELLPNAKFEIKDEEGNVVRKGKTDENGIAYFESLTYGKYTYREYDAPKGYQIDESEFPFEIKEDGEIVKAEMTNKKIVEEGERMPSTATNTFNYLLAGGVLLLIGSGLSYYFIRKRKLALEEGDISETNEE